MPTSTDDGETHSVVCVGVGLLLLWQKYTRRKSSLLSKGSSVGRLKDGLEKPVLSDVPVRICSVPVLVLVVPTESTYS